MAKKKSLGKGFGSLLPDDFDKSILLDKQDRIQKINISDIQAGPNQPRTHFDPASIDELSSSIKTYGILQPIILTPVDEKNYRYEIIAGERRFKAAKKAGLSEVPALIRSHKELEKLEIGLVENVQRVDLSPLEQAVSIARLNEEFNVDIKDVARRLGKAHTTIVNTVRLLQLPEKARKALAQQKISEGHARCVLALKDRPELQDELVDNIIQQGWSVRKAEEFVTKQKSHPKKISRRKLAETKQSKFLAKKINARVLVRQLSKGGKIEISYKSKEDLARIFKKLAG
ncbi:MAG TPA: ParB/RepB/Spo0J family partition protein [Candidatus Saccharimonadales bacterium]|nr:ParB/RepB/Spo0J family partition protein [Candidatus Saccharimonadales bacterium]